MYAAMGGNKASFIERLFKVEALFDQQQCLNTTSNGYQPLTKRSAFLKSIQVGDFVQLKEKYWEVVHVGEDVSFGERWRCIRNDRLLYHYPVLRREYEKSGNEPIPSQATPVPIFFTNSLEVVARTHPPIHTIAENK